MNKQAKVDTLQLSAVDAGERAKFVEVPVNNYTASFKVDSGVDVTAAPDSFRWIPQSLTTAENAIYGPGNHPLTVRGALSLTLW